MAMVGEMTLQDYENIKRRYPDLVIGESIGHSITIARLCFECLGNHAQEDACPSCGGSGYVPTADGEALLRLFRLFATEGRE